MQYCQIRDTPNHSEEDTVLAKSSATVKNLGKYRFIEKMFQTKRIGL